MGAMTDVTSVLSQIDNGDPAAAEQLLPLVYDELRKLAAARLAHEKPGQTLQPTALVHEAYLRLVGKPGETRQSTTSDQRTEARLASGPGAEAPVWNSRGHFFAAAAEAMRRILIEIARRKQKEKHGGGRNRIDLDEAEAVSQVTPDQLLAIDEALSQLESQDPSAAQLFKLRYFTSCPVEEAAELLGLSRTTAYRHWTFARAWLLSHVQVED